MPSFDPPPAPPGRRRGSGLGGADAGATSAVDIVARKGAADGRRARRGWRCRGWANARETASMRECARARVECATDAKRRDGPGPISRELVVEVVSRGRRRLRARLRWRGRRFPGSPPCDALGCLSSAPLARAPGSPCSMAPRNLRKKRPADSDDEDEDAGQQTLQERIEDARALIRNRVKAKVRAAPRPLGPSHRPTTANPPLTARLSSI